MSKPSVVKTTSEIIKELTDEKRDIFGAQSRLLQNRDEMVLLLNDLKEQRNGLTVTQPVNDGFGGGFGSEGGSGTGTNDGGFGFGGNPEVERLNGEISRYEQELATMDQEVARVNSQVSAYQTAPSTVPIGVRINTPGNSSVASMNPDLNAAQITAPENVIDRLQQNRDRVNSITTPMLSAAPRTVSVADRLQQRNTISSALPVSNTSGEPARIQMEDGRIVMVGDVGPNGGTVAIQNGQPVEVMTQDSGSGRGKTQLGAVLPLAGMIVGGIAGSIIPGAGTLAGAAIGGSIGAGLAGLVTNSEQQGIIDENKRIATEAYNNNNLRLEQARQYAETNLRNAQTAAEFAVSSAQVDAITALQGGQTLSNIQLSTLGGFIDEFAAGNLALAQEMRDTFALQNQLVNGGETRAAQNLIAALDASSQTLSEGIDLANKTVAEGAKTSAGQLDQGFLRAWDATTFGTANAQKQLGAVQQGAQGTMQQGLEGATGVTNAGFQQGRNALGAGLVGSAQTISQATGAAGNILNQGYGQAIQSGQIGSQQAVDAIVKAGGQSVQTLASAMGTSGLNTQQQLDVLSRGTDSPYYQQAVKALDQFSQLAMNPDNAIIQRRIQSATSEIGKQLAAKGITGPAAAKIQADMIQKITDEEATKQAGYLQSLAQMGLSQQQISNSLAEAKANAIRAGGDTDKAYALSIADTQMKTGQGIADYAFKNGLTISEAQQSLAKEKSQLASQMGQTIAENQMTAGQQEQRSYESQAGLIADAITKTAGNSAQLQAELGKVGVALTADQSRQLADIAMSNAQQQGGLTERTANTIATNFARQADIEAANQMTAGRQIADNSMNAGIQNAQNLGQARTTYGTMLSGALDRELSARTQGATTAMQNANLYAGSISDAIQRSGGKLADVFTGTGANLAANSTATANNLVENSNNYLNNITSGNIAGGALDAQRTQIMGNLITAPLMTAATLYGKSKTPTPSSGSGTTQPGSGWTPANIDLNSGTYSTSNPYSILGGKDKPAFSISDALNTPNTPNTVNSGFVPTADNWGSAGSGLLNRGNYLDLGDMQWVRDTSIPTNVNAVSRPTAKLISR